MLRRISQTYLGWLWTGILLLCVLPPSKAALPPGLLWKVSGVKGTPAVAQNGTIFICGSGNGYLTALASDGTLKWQVPIPAANLIAAKDGSVLATTWGSQSNAVVAIGTNGLIRWKFNYRSGWESRPALASDGTILVAVNETDQRVPVASVTNGVLYAISSNGSCKWVVSRGAHALYWPIVGQGGTVYVSDETEGTLLAFAPDGSLNWETARIGSAHSSPAIGADGTVYVPGGNSILSAVGLGGQVKWGLLTAEKGSCPPVVDEIGNVYAAAYSNHVYGFGAVSPSGNPLWWNPSDNSYEVNSPALALDGTVYCAGANGNLYAYNRDGTLKWTFAPDRTASDWLNPNGCPTILSSGALLYPLTVSTNDVLYALDARTPPLEVGWPTFRGNNQRTGGSLAPLRWSKVALQVSKTSRMPLISIQGVSGMPYRIEFVRNISSTNWQTLFEIVLQGDAFTYLDSAAMADPVRFYRAVQPAY